MKNNRGISLIEMIIVIAIMAVVGAVGLGFMTLQSNSKVNECANKIYSSISKVKVDAMSKSKLADGTDYCITLGKDAAADGGRYYLIKHAAGNDLKEIIGDKDYTITYKSKGGAEFNVSDAHSIKIKFERETGGFKKTTLEDGNDDYIVEIRVTNGSKVKKLTIVPITGKVTIE